MRLDFFQRAVLLALAWTLIGLSIDPDHLERLHQGWPEGSLVNGRCEREPAIATDTIAGTTVMAPTVRAGTAAGHSSKPPRPTRPD